MKAVSTLQKNSIDSNLCCHCGVCAGVCPTGAITCQNNCLITDENKCVDCGLCTACCPASGYPLSDMSLADIQAIPTFSAASTDSSVSDAASSGGFVTQALLSLLKSGDITAAAVVLPGSSPSESCAKYVVTDSADVILSARRSKYTQATLDNVIDHIKRNDGRYAVVGLPCQLCALSKAIKRLPILKNRIIYKFGMVCGYTYDEECLDGLLEVMGIQRKDVERILGWREGGLPGNFSVLLKDGSIKNLPFADEHSLDVTFYAQNRCKFCKDCLCEHGDIVSADIGGWREKRTLVMVRSSIGRDLIEHLSNSEDMIIEDCNIPFGKTVIPFMLKEKRAKVELRIKRAERRNSPVPKWGRSFTPNILIANKIEQRLSIALEERALKNKDRYSPKKKLEIGHRAYHRIASMFILKVIFKLQVLSEGLVAKILGAFKLLCEKLHLFFGNSPICLAPRAKRAVIIGLGQWGSQYLSFLSKSKHWKPVAAFDSDREKLCALAKKFRFAAAESIESLCTDYKANAIFVLTPTPSHLEVYRKVCGYGLPVYMEKPIASDTASAKELEMLSRSKELLYVAHSMKYEPVIRYLKDLTDSAKAGKILSVEMTRTVKTRQSGHYKGAALYQIGVHLIDTVLYLLGSLTPAGKISEISADKDVYDLAFDTKNGQHIALRYGFGRVYNFSFRIQTENMFISYSDSLLRIETEGRITEKKIKMENEKTVLIQLKEFYFAVCDNAPYLNTAQNAMQVIDLCDNIMNCGEK